MALSVELRGPRGDVLPVSSLSLTETPNEGWRWQVSLPYISHNYTVYTGDTPRENCYGNGTVSLLEAFLPHHPWFLTVSDGVNTLPLTSLVATDISETPSGGEVSGVDWVFYRLTSKMLDVSHMINDAVNTTTTALVSAAITDALGAGFPVSGAVDNFFVCNFGGGESNALAVVKRVLDVTNQELRSSRIAGNDTVEIINVDHVGSSSTVYSDCAFSSVTRRRNLLERKTSMDFVKSTPSTSSGTITNGRGNGGWNSKACQISSTGLMYVQLNNAKQMARDWGPDWWSGDPDSDANAHQCGRGSHCYGSEHFPITHARFRQWRYFDTPGQGTLIEDIWPPDGISADFIGHSWAGLPHGYQLAIAHTYDTGMTPALPEQSAWEETLWMNKEQIQLRQACYMWINNKDSHRISYSGPLDLRLRVGNVIRYTGQPDSRIEQVSHSISADGQATTSLDCAVLGAAQW